MTFRVVRDYELGPLLGLPSVVVHNMHAFACDACDDVILPGGLLDGISDALAYDLLSHSFPLRGPLVRYLRKHVGLTQSALAERLGVTRVTVARWETADENLDGPVSIAVRAVISAVQGKSPPVEKLRHAPESSPPRLELEAPSVPPPL